MKSSGIKKIKYIFFVFLGLLISLVVLVFFVFIGVKAFKHHIALGIIIVSLSVLGLFMVWHIITGDDKKEEKEDDLVIKVPHGFILDDSEPGVLKFTRPGEKKKKKLPRTWEEYCKLVEEKEGFCIDSDKITKDSGHLVFDEEQGEAILALMRLLKLRDLYVKDLVPEKEGEYWTIYENLEILKTDKPGVLSFPREKECKYFLNNFKDLILKLEKLKKI